MFYADQAIRQLGKWLSSTTVVMFMCSTWLLLPAVIASETAWLLNLGKPLFICHQLCVCAAAVSCRTSQWIRPRWAESTSYCHSRHHQRCSITHSLPAAAPTTALGRRHSRCISRHATTTQLRSCLPVLATTARQSSATYRLPSRRSSLTWQLQPCLRSTAKSQTSFWPVSSFSFTGNTGWRALLLATSNGDGRLFFLFQFFSSFSVSVISFLLSFSVLGLLSVS